MLMAHQKKKIQQYTNQYDRRKICSWQGVAAEIQAAGISANLARLFQP
jgi:hypothetical protein